MACVSGGSNARCDWLSAAKRLVVILLKCPWAALVMQLVFSSFKPFCLPYNGLFSRDVTAAMLVSQNKGTATKLVSPTNPQGIELFYHANVFFCFGGKTRLLIT